MIAEPWGRRGARCAARYGLLAGVLVVTCLLAAAAAEDFSALDRFLEDAAETIGSCGLRLVRDGDVLYERVVGGFAVNTVVPVYSASKWLSAAVVAALVDGGALTLDDLAADHFPALHVEESPITLRHLLTHTSGLPGEVPDDGCTDTMALQSCADRLSRLPVLTAPGRVFAYGEVSMQIAGAIAERAADSGWHELFAARIADPLGMHETDYHAFAATTNPVIGGGGQSTLRDYSRFVTMLLQRGRYDDRTILSPEAVDLLLTDQTPEIVYGPEHGVGLGCWRERVDPESGEILLASAPGANGFTPWVDFEHGVAGVLAVDGDGSKVRPIFLELLLLLDDLLETRDPAPDG
ncbi:MAG: beta-lactamase family protein [Candidatus Bipolaricaulota bacterium]|nr:MAG: beta-lactamase family protein [Candidatus Bipolaricaulota bacterium]